MATKKKGVSAEEKRTRMLQLFYEKKDFFQLKELEKIAPKEKGIIAQSVKDVVQGLVDDGMVDTDKIGTSVYFWAYPSKAKVSRETRLHEINGKLADAEKRLASTLEKLKESKVGKEDTEERNEIMRRVSDMTTRREELINEIKKYKDNDPEVLQQLKQETEESKLAVNRWTDNIFAIKSWCKNKFSVEENELDKQFGIPTELDYME